MCTDRQWVVGWEDRELAWQTAHFDTRQEALEYSDYLITDDDIWIVEIHGRKQHG